MRDGVAWSGRLCPLCVSPYFLRRYDVTAGLLPLPKIFSGTIRGQTYACDPLEDGKKYLRADYRIECDSTRHKYFMAYAGFMILVYTVGIPAFYGFLLFRHRDVLTKDDADREGVSDVAPTSGLWKPYRPSVFYYEVVECIRRFMLAGVVVFIYPNTAAQIAVTLLMAFFFVVLSEALAPYASR